MISNSFILSMVRGQIGNVVVKHYPDKIVVTKVPDMSGIEASPAQKTVRHKMKAAVAWAKQTNADPILRVGYIQQARGSNKVYQYLVKHYLRRGGVFAAGE